jgi:uncharacterized protein YjbI with pentapeptide repeats
MNWRQIFFGNGGAAKPVAQPSEPVSPSGGNGVEEIYAHAPETELRSSQQHKFLFDDGVPHWNRHRHAKPFKPNFAGLNFVKEAGKTRLFGRPVDLVGDERVMLAGIDLSYADLQGCTLTKADLRNANFAGANLRNANLTGALLNGADLRDADLRGANLDGAQLARTRLMHANLGGASCKNTNFAWADMRHVIAGAKNFAEANLFGVVRDDGVRFERRLPPPPPPASYGWQQPQLPAPQPPAAAQMV